MHSSPLRNLLAVGMIAAIVLSGCSMGAPSGGGTAGGGAAGGDATEAPAPTTPPTSTEIPHLMTPGSSSDAVANAHDNEESGSFEERNVRVGDEFRINRFERPFTAEDMTYLPQIDIVGMSMSQDEEWYYVQIKLVGNDETTDELSGTYGVEFDLNIDGKTEVMALAEGPIGPDWTAQGVKLYADLNGDIGGTSSRPDDVYSGDGYETLVYEGGQVRYEGETFEPDPDLVWVRGSTDTHVVEFGLKKSVLRDYPTWMWNPLASAYPLDPGRFYFNDTYTLEDAGSPTKGDYYPLKELAGFDNTCRVPANFDADGTEPMGCAVSQQKDLDFGGGGGSS